MIFRGGDGIVKNITFFAYVGAAGTLSASSNYARLLIPADYAE
jgi:hypothetical protein